MKKSKFDLLFENIMSQFDNDDDPSITQVIDEIQYDDDTIIEIYQNNDSKKFGYSIAMGKVGG